VSAFASSVQLPPVAIPAPDWACPYRNPLIDMHSGTLRIESAPGNGTSVIVALPLTAPQMLRKTA
jgi:hypothetical protein